MARDQLFRIVDILPPAIDTLIEARPRAEQHIVAGRYGDFVEGWGAQAAICRSRLARELIATRLRLATGQELVELAASEYWASRDSAPTAALGSVQLTRTVTNTNSSGSGNFVAGEVRAGHRFRKVGNPSATPPIEDADYEIVVPTAFGRNDSFDPVDLGGGNFQHTQTDELRLRSSRTGPHANRPIIPGATGYEMQSVDQLFDPTFVVASSFRAAGGSLNIPEDTLRQFARAMFTGRYGPTAGALIAGAFSFPGVAHVDVVEDTTIAVTRLFVADESWASSPAFSAAVEQHLLDEWVGFGGRVEVAIVENVLVTIECTVMLRDPKYRVDSTLIADAIRKKAVEYFDNRPKWWAWRLSTLGAVIGAADHRILACTDVVVRDRLSGNALAEPAIAVGPTEHFVNHYMVANDAVRATFEDPQ